MNTRKKIAPFGAALGLTFPIWITLPGISFVLELILIGALIVMIVERHISLALISILAGGLLGLIPGLSSIPVALLLPLWLKAVAPPLILGWLLNRGMGPGKSFAAAVLVSALFVLALYYRIGPMMIDQLEVMRKSVIQQLAEMFTAESVSQQWINGFTDSISTMFYYLKRLYPGLLILTSLSQLFVAFVLVEWLYKRRDSYFPGFGSFIYWKIPEKLLYLLATSLIVRLIFNGFWQQVADNALLVLTIFYAVAGLALIEHLLRKIQLPLLVKIVFYLALGIFQIPGLIAAALAGLFDSFFDFRKVRAHTLG